MVYFQRNKKNTKNLKKRVFSVAEFIFYRYCARLLEMFLIEILGRSLAGKAAAFGVEERRFESCRPSQEKFQK